MSNVRSHEENADSNRADNVQVTQRVRNAYDAMTTTLADLADLMFAADDQTRKDGKRACTTGDNRKAILRHYLDAIANVRVAQEELHGVLYPGVGDSHEG